MPTHAERRQMPYSAEQMFDLIARVEKYPEFLPWCSAARIRSRTERGDGSVVIDADLVVSFKVYRERFTSRVVLDRANNEIDVAYLDGPFRHLDNHWRFEPIDAERCDVDFYVDFEFRSRALQVLIGAVFNQAMQRIVRAFEKRAEELYARDPNAAAAVTTRPVPRPAE
ncbi:MAG: type II toxin-antitoxin system RatA family toxin [Pikeienuella sp.]